MPPIRRSPAERVQLVTDFRASGLSQRAFAEREGIKLTALQSWLYKPATRKRKRPPRFVRVEPAREDGIIGIHVQLGADVVVHMRALPEPEFFARLVRALAC